jgi:hypothetical protein
MDLSLSLSLPIGDIRYCMLQSFVTFLRIPFCSCHWIVFQIRKFLSLGSVSQRYGSGSFYFQVKILRKTLISAVLWPFHDLLSLKNYVIVPSKSNKQENLEKKKKFCCHLKGHLLKESGAWSGSVSPWYGSADPDPYQNVTDPEQWT